MTSDKPTHEDPAAKLALAAKILGMAEKSLSLIEREIMKWPPEFRAIMWCAVSDIAIKRKIEAEHATKATL